MKRLIPWTAGILVLTLNAGLWSPVVAAERSPSYKPQVMSDAKLHPIEKQVREFYIWYLGGIVGEPKFPKEPADRQRWRTELTRAFATSLDRLREESDADPVICAQDFFGEWIAALRVEKVADSAVLVTFGPPPTKLHQVMVTLREEDGRWKIDGAKLHRPKEEK